MPLSQLEPGSIQSSVVQLLTSYVVFVLFSSSLGMWLIAHKLSGMLRAYAVSITLTVAAVLLTLTLPLAWWLAGMAFAVAALTAVLNPPH